MAGLEMGQSRSSLGIPPIPSGEGRVEGAGLSFRPSGPARVLGKVAGEGAEKVPRRCQTCCEETCCEEAGCQVPMQQPLAESGRIRRIRCQVSGRNQVGPGARRRSPATGATVRARTGIPAGKPGVLTYLGDGGGCPPPPRRKVPGLFSAAPSRCPSRCQVSFQGTAVERLPTEVWGLPGAWRWESAPRKRSEMWSLETRPKRASEKVPANRCRKGAEKVPEKVPDSSRGPVSSGKPRRMPGELSKAGLP